MPPAASVTLVTAVPPALSPRALAPELPPAPVVAPGGIDDDTPGLGLGSCTVSTAPAPLGPVTCPLIVAGSPPIAMSTPVAALVDVSVTGFADAAPIASGYHSSANPAPL